jgi:RNA polymerase sigma-70 factor (ECF subfamily)
VEALDLDELLRRAGRRDPVAIGALVGAYSQRVFALLYRLTGSADVAEELVQETFLRVVRRISDYQNRGRFEAWLFRIAANLARDQHRRTRRRATPGSLDSGPSSQPGPPCDPSDVSVREPGKQLEQAETDQRLHGALLRLGELDREIILLRHYSELSFREIAELLGVPLGTALARAHRALSRLRAELGRGVGT